MTRRYSTLDEEAEINITPMLDIVFIMLIFFIVTASFIKETGIDPRRPEAQTATEHARGNILIAISAAGEIWMQKKQVELADVRAMVEAARKEIPESSAIIIADVKSQTGLLLDLMDQVRLGGVYNVSIAAQQNP